MARTTAEAVKQIMDDPPAQVGPHLKAATLVVDSVLADHLNDATLLQEIERWIAAHFAAIERPPKTSESIFNVSETLQQGQLGKALDATFYGQQAKVLDPSGRLANAGKLRPVFKAV